MDLSQRHANMKIISLIMFVSLCPQRSRYQKAIKSERILLEETPVRENKKRNQQGRGKERRGKHFRLPPCLRKVWQGYRGAVSQASGAPHLLGTALSSSCCTQSLTGSNPQTALFGCKVAIDFRLWCLDTWLILVPVVGVCDSHANGHHNKSIRKILRCCHYVFSTICKVVVPGNKASLSNFHNCHQHSI